MNTRTATRTPTPARPVGELTDAELARLAQQPYSTDPATRLRIIAAQQLLDPTGHAS